jgi:hypothetical protein
VGFAKAFDASPGAARANFVKLSDLRERLGGTREEQDAWIRRERIAGRFSLDTHDGVHGKLSDRDRAAAVVEGSADRPTRMIYISRR